MTERELLAATEALVARGTKPTVPEVQPLVDGFVRIPGNGAGGSLHIVLDDYNLETAHVEFCAEWAEKEGDKLGLALAKLLQLCSMTQRAKLVKNQARSR